MGVLAKLHNKRANGLPSALSCFSYASSFDFPLAQRYHTEYQCEQCNGFAKTYNGNVLREALSGFSQRIGTSSTSLTLEYCRERHSDAGGDCQTQ